MSLIDRTNERIRLSLHEPLRGSNPVGDYFHEADLYVDVDSDSNFDPPHWVSIHLIDETHDSDRIKLTYEEAGLLHDRLGLILGRPKANSVVDWARETLGVKLAPWQEKLAKQVEARLRSEWPGTHVPARYATAPETISPGGATDTLIKLATRIVKEEATK